MKKNTRLTILTSLIMSGMLVLGANQVGSYLSEKQEDVSLHQRPYGLSVPNHTEDNISYLQISEYTDTSDSEESATNDDTDILTDDDDSIENTESVNENENENENEYDDEDIIPIQPDDSTELEVEPQDITESETQTPSSQPISPDTIYIVEDEHDPELQHQVTESSISRHRSANTKYDGPYDAEVNEAKQFWVDQLGFDPFINWFPPIYWNTPLPGTQLGISYTVTGDNIPFSVNYPMAYIKMDEQKIEDMGHDLTTVLAHELGHILMLDHNENGSIMEPMVENMTPTITESERQRIITNFNLGH